MPFKLLIVSIHNYLTKRDYIYSIEDICDICIGIVIGIWIYLVVTWSDFVLGENENEMFS